MVLMTSVMTGMSSSKQLKKKKKEGSGDRVKITGFLWHLEDYLLNVFCTNSKDIFKRSTREKKKKSVCRMGHLI